MLRDLSNFDHLRLGVRMPSDGVGQSQGIQHTDEVDRIPAAIVNPVSRQVLYICSALNVGFSARVNLSCQSITLP
jgi:hypothetical protein